MSFDFIKDLDTTVEETTNLTNNINMICEGNEEQIQSLYEKATDVITNARTKLATGEPIPDNFKEIIAALRVLSDGDKREAISNDPEMPSPNYIRDTVKLAGPDTKANVALVNITKSMAADAFGKALSSIKKAETDDAARKQLIQTLGKMQSIMDRVQKQPDAKGEDTAKMASWFK